MKKEEKATAIAELTEKFGRARLAILTECAGMPVNQMTELRRQLRGAKAEYCVIKNTLAVRAHRYDPRRCKGSLQGADRSGDRL